MARAGRALRWAMLDGATANSPERVEERMRARRAGELAVADREARYPMLDASNVAEAMAYQAERQSFHYEALRG